MKPCLASLLAASAASAALVALGGCSIFDLAELDEQGTTDASVPLGDGAPGSDAASVDGGMPQPADASGPDAFDNPEIPPGAQLGSCDPSRWVATASDSHPSSPPVNAIDGLLPSRWSSGAPQAPGMYFQIDFGGYVMVDEVAINPVYLMDGHGDHPRAVDALVSGDGVDFSVKVGGALFGDPEPGIATVSWSPHAARYLRLRLTAGSGSWWSIHDLHVGCTVPGAPPPADAGPPNAGPDGGFIANRSGWSAAGTPTNGGDVAANAFDGNDGTRWADGKTPQYGDEVYQLDLGTVQTVSGVQLKAVSGDYPAAYALDLSTDNASYTEVARGLGGDVTNISFPRQQARYIRVRQVGAGYDHWWGINELNVAQ